MWHTYICLSQNWSGHWSHVTEEACSSWQIKNQSIRMTCVPQTNMISMRVHANQLCRRPSQWLIRQLRVFQELSLQGIGSGQSLHICPNQDLMLVGFGCISLVARIVRDKQCCCYILVGFSIDIAIFHWRGPLSWWILFKRIEWQWLKREIVCQWRSALDQVTENILTRLGLSVAATST